MHTTSKDIKPTISGFSIMIPPQAVAALKNNPNVKYVANNDIRYASAQTIPTGIQRIFADDNVHIDIDGLDDYRVDNGIGVVGVAPGARLWAVKVLDSGGSGYSSGIIAGIDWIASKADTIEVANMSLGGPGYNQAEYDAIQGAVDEGVAFAVAAGNDNDDASNWGPAVDIAAPRGLHTVHLSNRAGRVWHHQRDIHGQPPCGGCVGVAGKR